MGPSARLAEPDAKRRVESERLAEQQAALRRVATFVARGAASSEVFDAVAQEVAQVLHLRNAAVGRYDDDGTVLTVLACAGAYPDTFSPGSRWPLDGPSMSREVLRTGRPVRVEEYTDLRGKLAAEAREHGFSRVAGAPIVVEGRVWGVIATASPDEPLPDDLEEGLAEFTELVATAIANSQANEELRRLAEEQAALRRVATVVAEGAEPNDVFGAVADEVAAMFGVTRATMLRFDPDGHGTLLATAGDDFVAVGDRFSIEETELLHTVFATGRSAHVDDWSSVSGPGGELARRGGIRSSVAVPIVVEGALWGMITAASHEVASYGADVEARLAKFTELLGTAIASSQAHDQLSQLADEQAALRRVATLVAAGAPPAAVFEAVSTEVAALVGADGAALTRFEADGTVTALSGWTTEGGYNHVGTRYPGEGTVSGLIFETGRPARIESYADAPGPAPEAAREMGWRSSVGAPITVEGRLWGALAIVSRTENPVPPDTEERLAAFTELVATAIANSDAHQELARLADEQAALRRVATLAAEGAPPDEVFAAVSAEVAPLVGADGAGITRYEADGMFTAVGGWANSGGFPVTGRRFPLEGSVSGLVLETRCPSRIDSFEGRSGEAAAVIRELGWRSAVGAPISVEGRLWGVLVVYSKKAEPLPADTERRLGEFTQIVATAIANTESRAELETSRARIVTTADATRRQIERDLHDGAQQQLVSLALEVRAAQAAVPPALSEHRAELSHVADGLTNVLDGLREIALGIHPGILAEGGLGPALKTLAHRSPVPVSLEVRADRRLPEPVEVAAYYVVSEALTNAAKHSRASQVEVSVEARGRLLRVAVRDDGAGGADPDRGSGLLGLKDRAEAIGGTIRVESPEGQGTTLVAELPLDHENL